MAYDSQFLRFTWNFSIIGTEEIAQTSLNMKPPGVWTAALAALNEIKADAPLQALLLTRMATLMGNVQLQWADYSRLNSIRVGAVDTTGLELDSPMIFEDNTPPEGTVVGTILPQASVVASLRSGLVTGSGNFGRMYLPHTALSMLADSPHASSTTTATVAEAFRVFLNAVRDDVNEVIAATVFPFIMTQVAGQSSKLVQEIRVGDVTDTQRRRRNQLQEVYSVLPIPS